jgi:glycerol-3-phosphate acyltransferase PlsY
MNDTIVFLTEKPWLLALLCSLTGYLIGSVSSARIIYYLVTKNKNIEPFSEPVPHSDEIFESNLVSATLVAKKLGGRYGCVTSIADMIKVGVPTLLVKLLFITQPYFMLTAIFGVLGHNFPVYYRFIGGRGESPIIGILLVVNWFGLILVNIASTVLGFITGSVLVVRWGGYVLLIFWLWYYFQDVRYAVFMVILNLLFWFSMRKDLARFQELKKKKGLTFTEEDVSEFIQMGRGLGRFLDKYSLYVLSKKIIHKFRNRNIPGGD